MISAVHILLIYMTIGMGFSMFVEKMSIKQEKALREYRRELKECEEMTDLLAKSDIYKVSSLSNEITKEVEEVEQMMRAVGEHREFHTGLTGTLHVMFCWPFIILFGVLNRIVNKK